MAVSRLDKILNLNWALLAVTTVATVGQHVTHCWTSCELVVVHDVGLTVVRVTCHAMQARRAIPPSRPSDSRLLKWQVKSESHCLLLW